MKNLFLVLLFCGGANCWAQTNKKLNCKDLSDVLNYSMMKKHFVLKKNVHDTLIIADTFNVIECNENPWNKDGLFLVTNQIPSEAKLGENSSKNFKNRPLFNVVVLENVSYNKNKYTLRFWQAKDNATITLEYSNCKKRSKIRLVTYGVY